jgi:hypothetical protein
MHELQMDLRGFMDYSYSFIAPNAWIAQFLFLFFKEKAMQ